MAISRRLMIGTFAMCIAMVGVGFDLFQNEPSAFRSYSSTQTANPALNKGVGTHERPSPQLGSVNPLASLALDSLKETIERPLFNRTRAPRPPPVLAEEPQVEPQQPQASPEDFTLLGVVISENGKTALLRLNKTNEVFRLKSGQMFADWAVTEIGPRSIVIKKENQTFTIQLFGPKAPNSGQQPGGNDDEDGAIDQVSDNG